MSIRFRKTFNLGGGLKLNLNKKSAGLSFGGKGARFSVNSDGRKTTSVGIPGTGIYWTKTSDGKSSLTPLNIITLIILFPFILLYWLIQLILWPFKLIWKAIKKNKFLKTLVILLIIMVVVIFGLMFVDKIKITINDEIRYVSLTDDLMWNENKVVTCYDDTFTYLDDKDITVTEYSYKKILFLYYHKVKFEDGNMCDYEYYLEEDYLLNIINNGEIIDNDNNIDIKELIDGKEAIVLNKKYVPEDWNQTKSVLYKINGEYKEIIVFNIDDLLIIEIGLPDESPKYIAYK